MAYMKKDERRQLIINTAVDIVLSKGLNAATSRAVAAEIGCAPAQIHHHFPSASALRAEAIRIVIKTITDSEIDNHELLNPKEKLLNLMMAGYSTQNSYAATLWNDGLISSRNEEPVRDVISEIILDCQGKIEKIIQNGKEIGFFQSSVDTVQTALRLMTFVIGYDQLSVLKLRGYNLLDLHEHLNKEIDSITRV